MNQIITIGREFGSGGREFGKRLAEELGYAYYDREIMEEISKRTQLAESYIHHIVEGAPGVYYPITVGKTLHAAEPDYLLRQYTSVYAEQANTIRDMAEKSDCVIVGRCADYILRDRKDCLHVFICSDMASRARRIVERYGQTPKAPEKRLAEKDQKRKVYYKNYTGRVWGQAQNYDICLNSGALGVDTCTDMIVQLCK